MFEVRSALAAVWPAAGADAPDGRRRLRIGEHPAPPLWQVGIYPGQAPRVASAWSAAAPTLPWPTDSAQVAAAGDLKGYRIAADQYWFTDPAGRLGDVLLERIATDMGSVTELTAARVWLGVQGEAAREFLSRLVSIDLAPAAFPVGRFAQTGIHHIGGLLEHVAADEYRFVCLRTYAVDLAELWIDTARSFGFDLGLG